MAILDEFVEGGKVDPSIVEIIRKDQQHCFQIARGEVGENPFDSIPNFDEVLQQKEQLKSP
jgi:hypothetical protein